MRAICGGGGGGVTKEPSRMAKVRSSPYCTPGAKRSQPAHVTSAATVMLNSPRRFITLNTLPSRGSVTARASVQPSLRGPRVPLQAFDPAEPRGILDEGTRGGAVVDAKPRADPQERVDGQPTS